METLENQVDEAEQEIGQSSGKLKNMLKPLFSVNNCHNSSSFIY